MSKWSDILDDSVAGRDVAKHLQALRLPTLAHWEPGRIRATCNVDSDLLTPVVGSLFGGYIAALADHILANAVFTVLEDDEGFATAGLHVHFLRPAHAGVLDLEASVVARGRRSAYCEAWIRGRDGTLIARAGATQAIWQAADAP